MQKPKPQRRILSQYKKWRFNPPADKKGAGYERKRTGTDYGNGAGRGEGCKSDAGVFERSGKMNLEFRHEIEGLWGYHEVNEISWCFDDDVIAKACRELRKDRGAVLWVMDVSNEVDFESVLNLSLSWDTWEDYDDKVVTVTIWKNWNDFEYRKMPWEKGKHVFKEVIKRAVRGDVKTSDVFKPQKVY